MSKQAYPKDESPALLTCKNCVHMIRKNGEQDTVVCVPHLKDVPGNEPLACELHTLKNKSLEDR